jgi:hypothetical protein
MTPEELNRTMDFIIQSQARLAVAQEQDREQRVKFEEWSKGLHLRVTDLIEVQSRRLDRHEDFMRETRESEREFQKDMKKRHEELLALLDRIIKKLTERLN